MGSTSLNRHIRQSCPTLKKKQSNSSGDTAPANLVNNVEKYNNEALITPEVLDKPTEKPGSLNNQKRNSSSHKLDQSEVAASKSDNQTVPEASPASSNVKPTEKHSENSINPMLEDEKKMFASYFDMMVNVGSLEDAYNSFQVLSDC